MVRSEEEAYEKIAEELGVKTLKLGICRRDVILEKLIVDKGYTNYNINIKIVIYFYSGKIKLKNFYNSCI